MQRFSLAAALVAAAVVLAGCKPGEVANRVLDGIEDVADAIQIGVGYTKEVARKYCGQVGEALKSANSIADTAGASCKARNEVRRLASGVASFCNNIDAIGPADIRGVVVTVRKARDDARKVVAAGC